MWLTRWVLKIALHGSLKGGESPIRGVLISARKSDPSSDPQHTTRVSTPPPRHHNRHNQLYQLSGSPSTPCLTESRWWCRTPPTRSLHRVVCRVRLLAQPPDPDNRYHRTGTIPALSQRRGPIGPLAVGLTRQPPPQVGYQIFTPDGGREGVGPRG